MPDWPVAKICVSSSTPNESLANARSTLSRSGSPPALHRAESSSQSSWRIEGTRKFMGWQSSYPFVSSQVQYQNFLILVDKWCVCRTGSVNGRAKRANPQQIERLSAGKTAQVTICHCPRALPEGKCSPFFRFVLFINTQENSDAQPS